MDAYPLLKLYDFIRHNQPKFICDRLIQEVDYWYIFQDMTAIVSLGLFIAFISATGRSQFLRPVRMKHLKSVFFRRER